MCGLARDVIRYLTLIENGFAAFAEPLNLLLLEMLDCETQRCHVVAVDNHPMHRNIARPACIRPVVCTPRPDVIQNHIVAIDLKSRSSGSSRRSTDAEEDIVE